MKTIKYLIIFTLSLFVLNSCGDEVDGTEDINFISFGLLPANISVEKNSSTSVEIRVFTTQITSSDRTFNVLVGSETTLDPSNYTIPSTIVVPANSNVGVITAVFKDVTLGEAAKSFQLELESTPGVYAGGKISTKITKKCSLSGVSELVGTYKVTTNTSGLENTITTQLDGVNLKVLDLGKSMITGWWGEQITAGGTCTISINLTTGALTIPRQYFVSTVYDGDPYTYEIAGSGQWNNCGATPTLILTYDVYYTGASSGIGKDYLGKAFGGLFTKN